MDILAQITGLFNTGKREFVSERRSEMLQDKLDAAWTSGGMTEAEYKTACDNLEAVTGYGL